MTTQISLSFELICLIDWLLKHERQQLNMLIKQALSRGLIDEFTMPESTQPELSPEQLYVTVLDFLDSLEQMLIKNLETVSIDASTKDAILPALQKIETDNLDSKTVWVSMQQTKALVNKSQQSFRGSTIARKQSKPLIADQIQTSPVDILLEQLLKNWKPNNKETIN